MDIEQLLRSNMEKEKHLMEFYMAYVKRIQDPELRSVLFKLIEGSATHYHRFKQLYLKKFLMDKNERNLNDIEIANLLDEGMKEERGAQALYTKQLSDVNDQEVQALLQSTIADEKIHEKLLNSVYTKLMKK